jgi:hypothetical protein
MIDVLMNVHIPRQDNAFIVQLKLGEVYKQCK